ncbi:MAG TPA: T9SS type A sorting domain-containing protein [Chitinophagales bacterium]|nr:T9SS type A sorting domain-containing protein [Chitinophagales bacterium]
MKKSLLLLLLFISNFSLAQNPLMKQWDYRFGGISDEVLTSFQQTSDGGYILGGLSGSEISGDKTQDLWGDIYDIDYWIVKTDSLGNKEWDGDFGGIDIDVLTCLQQTADGGYILCGYSYSVSSGNKTQTLWGGADYWIVKIDSLGIKQWDKDFGGIDDDTPLSIQQTADGGYIFGGRSLSQIIGTKTQASRGGWDYWIVKTDAAGTQQWDKDFGGTADDLLFSIDQTDDGGYILGGYSNSDSSGDKTQPTKGVFDYWIVKTDSLGIKQWDKDFGGVLDDKLYSLQQTTDGGYILGGISWNDISGDKTYPSWGYSDYWILKTDSSGNKQWDKDFGGTYYEDEFGKIWQSPDGKYLMAGTSYSPVSGDKTESNLGNEQSWIIKTDVFGNKQWDKTLRTGTNSDDEIGLAVQTKDGCYAMANSTYAGIGGDKTQQSRGGHDYWFIKFCDTSSYISLISSDQSFCEKSCINFLDQSNNVNNTSWLWHFPGGDPSSSTDQNPSNICYNTSGTYDVTLIATNASGTETLTLSNYITVYAAPPVPTITQAGYTLTSSPASSYQWQFNSADIPGATNQSYTILQTGYYTVVAGDPNGCVNSFTEYVLISGIHDVMSDANISVYPNPSSGSFMVEWLNPERIGTGGLMAGEVSIDVVNMLGQKVFSFSEKISSANWTRQFDLSDDTRGIYFIEVKTKNEFVRKKIVIAD